MSIHIGDLDLFMAEKAAEADGGKSPLMNMNPREIKESIESTDAVQSTLEHDMAMMDKAVRQLKLRKKREAEEREGGLRGGKEDGGRKE